MALSVAIAVFSAPTASAQTLEAAQPSAVTGRALLSPTAFARLMQPPVATVAPAPVPVVKDQPRLDLRQATVAMALEARVMAAKAPQQKSWASRHKAGIIVGALLGGLILAILLTGDTLEAS